MPDFIDGIKNVLKEKAVIQKPFQINERFGFQTASGITFLIQGTAFQNIRNVFISLPDKNSGSDYIGARTGLLGTKIISDFTFGNPNISNTYVDLLGNTQTYQAIVLDLVLLTVDQSKNIVKTKIQGKNSTVKEYVSDDDYTIELKGIISSNDDTYPETLVQQLINICKIPCEIPVSSSYLTKFGINNIVIEHYSFPQVQGFSNQQEFTISMVSDEPLQLSDLDTKDLKLFNTLPPTTPSTKQ